MTIRPDPVQRDLTDLAETDATTIWFAPRSCVFRAGDRRDVFVGGVLVGSVASRDVAQRNVLLVLLAEDPRAHLGELARAFGISTETLREVRAEHARDGLEAIVRRRRGGARQQPQPALVRDAEALFEVGHTVSEVFDKLGKKRAGSRSRIGRLRANWAAKRTGTKDASPGAGGVDTSQSPLTGAERAGADPASKTEESGGGPGRTIALEPQAAAEPAGDAPVGSNTEHLATRQPVSAASVQHVGAWLLVATVNGIGLHEVTAKVAAVTSTAQDRVRLAVDAVLIALALGERCVEGVRRLATASAAALLLSVRAPSASWVRRTLGRLATPFAAALLHQQMALRSIARAGDDVDADDGPVFYVDNHLRPYSGKQALLRGWRMQEKRAVPGTTDYYVHDEDGRPLLRYAVPHHGALTDFLSPVSRRLREALGGEASVLVAFDRAGSLPNQMAELRDEGIEFVTYERRPYVLLSRSTFDEEVRIGSERLWLHESRANLGGGRGRVRRISVLTEDGQQLNLLAMSARPARRLIEVMRGRWSQENAFKHGAERWGFNHLDGRRVQPYAPGTVIPNPARRRLDVAIKVARVDEGLARAELARRAADAPDRAELDRRVNDAVAKQRELLALRPSMPTHAPFEETELKDVLVQHEQGFKMVVDTIRIAAANAESDLALLLAPHLPRPAEAKKALANLFAAPGSIRVSQRTITVTITPAATKAERRAFAALFEAVNAQRLTLPADQKRRPLRFRLAQESQLS